MPKKSLIAILSSVLVMIIAALTLVFTVGPMVSADEETIVEVASEHLNIENNVLKGFKTEYKSQYQNGTTKYSIVVPNGVTCIYSYAFEDCRDLTSITIPEGVSQIAGCSFKNCSSLTSIEIPSSVTSIPGGTNTFSGCSSLTSIKVNPDNPIYTSDDNNSCIIQKSDNCLILGFPFTVIPDAVTSIGFAAFSGYSGLTTITIPSSVTSIGSSAFSSCSGLTSVTFAENSQLTSIGYSAFYDCSDLTSITIPASVTEIGTSVFYNCSKLTEIIVENPDLMNNANLQNYKSQMYVANCAVTFINDDGTQCGNTQNIVYNDYAIVPSLQPQEGYELYWREEGKEENLDLTQPIKSKTATMTLTAHWEPIQYTVTFMDGDETVDTQNINHGSTATIPTGMERSGYAFKYWHLENDDEPFDFANTPITDNITLYTKWNPIYTVTFYMNGGSADYSSAKVENGYYATKPTTNPTKTGYTFRYWYAENEDEPFDFEHTEITANITLNAKWQINTYTVTFVTDGGTLTGETTQPVEYNKRLTTLPTAEWEGHVFKKWVDQNQNEFTLYTYVKDNLTVHAVWVDLWTVTFNTNGGTEVADQFVENGNRAQRPYYDPTKENFFFNGWYADENCTTGFAFNTPITQNTTIYAGWWPKYYVTFVYNNGDEDYIYEATEGEQVWDPYVNNKVGHDFDGWFYADGSEVNFPIEVTEDITLIAHWKPKSYTITFNSNGGSAVAKQKVNYGDKVTRPTDPTLPGYTFVGWNYNNKLYNFNTTVTKSITLKAKWEVREYTVTYNTNGGNTIPSVFGLGYGDKVEKPADPIKDGYTFKGWYIDASYTTEFDFNTGITDDITIYAKWEVIPAQVNVAAVAGGTAGGVAGVGALGTLIGFAIRKKRRLK